MLTPVKELNWIHNVNNSVNLGNAKYDAAHILLGIKNALLASGWTARFSSNREQCGYQDLWDSPICVQSAGRDGAVGSWIILHNHVLAGGLFELLIHCSEDAEGKPTARIGCSVTGYTGGSVSALPTAQAELLCWYGEFTSQKLGMKHWHVSVSENLKSTRIYTTRQGKVGLFMCFEEPKNYPAYSAATDRWVAWVWGDDGDFDKTSFEKMCETLQGKGYKLEAGKIDHGFTCEGFGGLSVPQSISMGHPEESNQWPIFRVGLIGHNPEIGFSCAPRGIIRDMYFVPEGIVTGSTHPGSGSYDWIVLGNILIPWDNLAGPPFVS